MTPGHGRTSPAPIATPASAQVTNASPYFAVLPEDAKPPLDLNRDMTAKYRTAMSQFYLHLEPRLK